MSEKEINIILNSDLTSNNNETETALYGENYIYEVLRVIEGVPLFIEKHLARLHNSCESSNVFLKSDDAEIESSIAILINHDQFENGNIKIIVVQDELKQNHIFIQSNPHYYPNDEEYNLGVSVITHQVIRLDPTSKLNNEAYKDEISQLIAAHNVFEILLVNESGEITEGSKSNFFGVKNGQVFTTPSINVLPGVTRETILEICKSNQIVVNEISIKTNDMTDYESFFLSGTSLKVLPIKQSNKNQFSTNNTVLQTITNDFNSMVKAYIKSKK
ncbi:MAG: aminotransferase class IV [Flavobacteriales bacterium]|nr:aminotransferase class IV [Flavobacteriales bacterium]